MPLERLEIIRRSMQNSKQRFSRMTANEILNYSAVVYGPAGLNIMSGMLPKRQAFNLVISNVPGPREPLYWNGAKLDALYPASIVMDGQALNITMTSYLDKLEVGLTACRNALPKMQNLLTHLEDEIQRFEEIIEEKQLTALMITHNLSDALRYGNRLMMMHRGKIIRVFEKEEKDALTEEKLYQLMAELDEADFNQEA